MKKPEDFKKQAEVKGITFWPSHRCSICGVEVGTEIDRGEASYRSACGCAWSPNHSHGWENVAERYNRQTNPVVIEEMNRFWGFDGELMKYTDPHAHTANPKPQQNPNK